MKIDPLITCMYENCNKTATVLFIDDEWFETYYCKEHADMVRNGKNAR